MKRIAPLLMIGLLICLTGFIYLYRPTAATATVSTQHQAPADNAGETICSPEQVASIQATLVAQRKPSAPPTTTERINESPLCVWPHDTPDPNYTGVAGVSLVASDNAEVASQIEGNGSNAGRTYYLYLPLLKQ